MSGLNVVIAACYGASNTGQLAGVVATELARENESYSLVCVPAVATDKATGLDKIRGAGLLVVIEGCPIACGREIIEEHADRKPDIEVDVVRDYGVKKAPTPVFDEAEKERIKRDVSRRIKEKLSEKRQDG
ncbi:MAG: putative zinc-binding protein [Chloroflexota bacterium]